ncbi:MAG: LytR/AlgR family response regulator transcription factor, partial [Eggerthella lenta]
SVYRTEHLYFLVKPFAQDDLDDALSRVLERLEADSSKPLSVRLGSRVVLVEPSRISYIESDRRKVRIHAGAEEIEAYASLSDLSAELPASFIQCHKSFLVNMDHVKELKADSVVLSSNQVVPVSQKRRKFVREAVFSRVQSKL